MDSRRERGIDFDRCCGKTKYFFGVGGRKFSEMAIDNDLVLPSKVLTITAASHRQSTFMYTIARQRTRMIVDIANSRNLKI